MEKNRRLNYHVIFSEQLEPGIIEKEFLEMLEIQTTYKDKRALTKSNIIEVGKSLKKDSSSLSTKIAKCSTKGERGQYVGTTDAPKGRLSRDGIIVRRHLQTRGDVPLGVFHREARCNAGTIRRKSCTGARAD